MRKLLLLMALLLPLSIVAQEVENIESEPTQIQTTQVRYIGESYSGREYTPTLYRHDLRVGLGATGLSLLFYLDTTFEELFPPKNETMSDILAHYRFDYGELRLTPVISLEYSYAVNDWFAIGFKGSYVSMYRNRTHAHTGERHGRVSLTVINAMVNARFQWLNRDIVKMYSSLGLGAMTAFGLVKESFFFYDATWVGLAVGEKVYGYFEFGGGASGVARAGLGVRF